MMYSTHNTIFIRRWMVILSLIIWHLSICVAQGTSTTDETPTVIRIGGKVFGGARQANVQGHTFVNIGANHHDVVINAVYGGNDIAGTIGYSTKPAGVDTDNHYTNSDIGNYNTFVRTDEEATGKHLFIGRLFGGGYGNYRYYDRVDEKYKLDYTYKVWDDVQEKAVDYEITLTNLTMPHIDRAYVDLHGGTFGYVYGGGDSVTVNDKTHICINNESQPWNITLSNAELLKMGINTEYFIKDGKYNFSRVFGGNNKADMAIMPKWHLQAGKIDNLYSGGNEGNMTSPIGLLLEINPEVPSGTTASAAETIKNKLEIEKVYGGCRKADVHPLSATGQAVGSEEIQLPETMLNPEGNAYQFRAGLAARVLVYGGKIKDVYGGNDVSGRVYGGNAVGIYSSISGNVFGGGNGSYPYTDNAYLSSSPIYGDFYYNPRKVLGLSLDPDVEAQTFTQEQSVQALNMVRPNAEQVSIRVKGQVKGEGANRVITPTVIGGAIFVGGNSATLKNSRENPFVELRVGSHVIADKVFLGNNGEYMKQYENTDDVLNLYQQQVKADGSFKNDSDPNGTTYKKFNSIDMTVASNFAKYMDGCALNLNPGVVFDNDYEDYSTYFGSFYCGGNVGSITKSGLMTITFDKKVIVYSKVVGGCNDAYVEETAYNAAYQGGIIGSDGTDGTTNERTSFEDENGHIKNRLQLNFNGLKIMPLRSPVAGIDDGARTDITIPSHIPLVWNTIRLGEREEDEDGNMVPVRVAWNNNIWKPADSKHTALYNSTVNRRFNDGNIYGGCCNSGVVNGNVVININATVVDRDGKYGVFDVVTTDDKTGEDKLYGTDYDFTDYRAVSGVILGQQGMDVLGSALNIFGGGKGLNTEIWGSTTINLNRGYVFQIFGGSEQGAIGKRKTTTVNGVTSDDKDEYNRLVYEYNPKYSTYVNLSGSDSHPGVPKSQSIVYDAQNNPVQDENLAEAEFLYGGGFEGPIAGNTRINLDNGRVFNTFAGSCNADIQGHTETYIGVNGFPYVRDYVYGGNDLGGQILANGGTGGNDCNFQRRLRCYDDDHENGVTDVSNNNAAYLAKINKINNTINTDVFKASAYIEYIQGRAEKIFGGCYGVYDYTSPLFGDYFYASNAADKPTDKFYGQARADKGYSKPYMKHAFINFRPIESNNVLDAVNQIYGAGQGYFGEREENLLQESSYILIDIPQNMQTYQGTEVFGGGECGGVGMGVAQSVAEEETTAHKASAIIDLLCGDIKAVYGGSYKEGITRRTVVNVPVGSTIKLEKIFGGAYGRIDEVLKEDANGNPVLDQNNEPIIDHLNPRIDVACDVYEAIVNWNSEDAIVGKALYGGNNACRRTLYGKVNVNAPVYNGQTSTDGSVKYTASVYGAGYGADTWSQYTEVNLNDGASVYEVYGGGENGQVLNLASVNKWKETQTTLYTNLEKDYEDLGLADDTPANSNRLYTVDSDNRPKYYNTNVHIRRGAIVGGYCYGGGLGHDSIAYSGNVYGTTYIDLLGGTVTKDLYAAGTTGSVKDSLGAGFIASATAYIEGGTARNVYGGGWKGSVGHHNGVERTKDGKTYIDYLEAQYYNTSTKELIDRPGETHVIIGLLKEKLAAVPSDDPHYHFYNGIPTVERNAYGGGEGGAVWGTTNITLNNGYIGYEYDKTEEDVAGTAHFDERYIEKIEDNTYTDSLGHFQSNKRLDDAGCVFGGGYVDNSSVDFTNVTMYGGHVRNALFGGGEIAAVGRGKIVLTGVDNSERTLQGIYRPGGTHIEMFDGYVHRNVFGGGRGYNNLGESGKLYSDGYVFGQTKVHIHGGEIGTTDELIKGNGNVFGGGDIGYVYSAYEYDDGHGHKLPRKGVKSGVRYDGDGMYQGYYYEHDWEDDPASATEENQKFIKYLNGVESVAGNERKLTEDCAVLIAPHCKVTDAAGLSFTVKYAQGQVLSDHDLMYLRSTNNQTLLSKIDAYGKVNDEGGLSFTRSFAKGQYVPTSSLNTLGNKVVSADVWGKLESNNNDDGIIIHNAVFAGGNTTKGADEVSAYANSTSVYGNATASIHDCYHRDLITIGTGHIGGLYGDGNLTLVDGYRGLNITNYGTDYHYLYDENNWTELSTTDYNRLLDREKDYYELRYKCKVECVDNDGTHYYPQDSNHTKASTLTADDIMTLFAGQTGMFENKVEDGHTVVIPSTTYWEQNGVCSIYAGRILNTIQRADFCGVFGSRMVMQGAQDRVPKVVDYTKYTINRVREVSLNRKYSVIDADASNDKRKMHGNYFGIYSVVNFLGALTSDFDFGDQGTNSDADDAAGRIMNADGTYSPLTTHGDVGTGGVRTSDNINTGTYGPQYPDQTFYGWKRFHHDDRERNNGNSHNKVALASGVYLELTTEESTGKDLYEKDWGLITGVIELDLINVQQGMGGGFVYAKNVHGKRSRTNRTNTTLTALNAGAATRWDFIYSTTETDADQREWQTSGNFVHSTQTIIDDCYNVSYKYMGSDKVPAHYWYIKGSVYVYDQYISAYTGATNAYSEMVDIPLTITAASHGGMKLLNVQPNKYAYKNTDGTPLTSDQKLIINDIEYTLNSPISYWDWNKLTAAERALFVPETMVSIAKYKYTQSATEEFPADKVMLPSDYEDILTHAHHKTDKDGHEILVDGEPIYQLWDVENKKYVLADSIIRSSNNLSHGTGYILTYKVNNPTDWDTWYTEYLDTNNTSDTPREMNQDKNQLAIETVDGSQKGPNEGPTYRLTSATGALLGQRQYKVSDLISDDVYNTYQAVVNSTNTDISGSIPHPSTTDEDYAEKKQATFERAYIAKVNLDIERTLNNQTSTAHLLPGSQLSATEAAPYINSTNTQVAPAFICTKTIQLSETDNLYINSVMTEAEKTSHIGDVNTAISTLLIELNDLLEDYEIDPISTTITDIKQLTPAQQNKISALKKKELSDLLNRRDDLTKCIVPAYYCTDWGKYGGNYYKGGINYRGLEAWSSMSEDDRKNFTFNYDAFDLLIDPRYSNPEGEKYQYDGVANETAAMATHAGYSVEKPVDYTATYNGEDINLTTQGLSGIIVKRGDNDNFSTTVIKSGDELSRLVFEGLPNEQRHYAPLTVDLGTATSYTYYVVNEPLLIGPTPYTTGNFISKNDYDGLYSEDPDLNQQGKVTPLTFTASGTYYYCREEYNIGNVTPVAAENVSGVVGSIGGGKVEKGAVISSGSYGDLTNLQKNFTIHGIAPTETSTLFVSRFSDINDLSTEKIITVIYQYDYEESDVSGQHITPVTERHVLNIHINFKTGAPIVPDIDAPPIILPGEYLGLTPPDVIEGASPIQGGGWELYETESDADIHNGIPYTPNLDPLYWYQHGYWLRYYALSLVGGKTYSNKVQVSVANYHDLKKVMEDTEHHYYIDIPNLDRLREPKIYIKDATNGINQLKELFNLSLLTTTPTGSLTGHALLNQQVNNCQNLEFIMQTNITMPTGTGTSAWVPIANNDDECFAGTLHGDGYYISGLTGSLFNHLCGNVYNLGVMGSFSKSGVADAGKSTTSSLPASFIDGYVENCWIATTNTGAKTSKPVFGTTSNDKYHIVNCYYLEEDDATNKYPNNSGIYPGTPTCMPEVAFNNGTVAYNLNGFYLYKRYNDVVTNSGTLYKYFIPGVVNSETGQLVPQTKYYYKKGANDEDLNAKYCSSGTYEGSTPIYVAGGYVEDRYADGDFRYAGGVIPTWVDDRLYTDAEGPHFYPIWPDDYLFFGQMLTYGWNTSRIHEDVPSHLTKTDGRLFTTDESNRVYRAPAYFQSKNMEMVHFNPDVNLAATWKPVNADDINPKKVYPNMTAIDFAGHNDVDVANPYKLGLNGTLFYQPLLDDDGLHSIVNRNETPNLLVYAPSSEANSRTYNVLTGYFTEPEYNDYYEGGDYRCVKAAPTQSVFGHLVQSTLIATNDHLLVDKKDFNCPISYYLDNSHVMWYQRVPSYYVTPVFGVNSRSTKGWEGISVPFAAELVTTSQKGEITHFYSGSNEVFNKGNAQKKPVNSEDPYYAKQYGKVGHEYWLREFTGIDSEKSTSTTVVANLEYPNAISGYTKDYKNTFLWDYYYQYDNAVRKDKNTDDYQYDYYKMKNGYVQQYVDYPMLGAKYVENNKEYVRPYIIGFPGETFYEFDLSGKFDHSEDNIQYHPLRPIPKIGEQTITFASTTNAHIGVSDDELKGVTPDGSVYTFIPNYLNDPKLESGKHAFLLNRELNFEGNSYKEDDTNTTVAKVEAFRPYFTGPATSSARPVTRSIIFSNEDSQLKGVVEKGDPTKEEAGGMLNIYAKKHKIIVESSLNYTTDVRIVNLAGMTINSFTIEPGEAIETRVNNSGVYIVQPSEARYIKKLSVK